MKNLAHTLPHLSSKIIIFANVSLIGGVSNYALRLRDELIKGGHKVEICDPARPAKLLIDLLKFVLSRDTHFYFQTQNFVSILIILLTGIAKRSVIFDHNSSRHFTHEGRIARAIRSYVYRRTLAVLLVDKRLLHNYRDLSPNGVTFGTFEVLYEPSANEPLSYPPEIEHLLSSNCSLIVTSASRFSYDEMGLDIYSIEALGFLFQELSVSFPEAHFLLALSAEPNDKKCQAVFQELLSFSSSHKNFHVITNMQLWPILQKTSLFLRITTTDGDSISVREALKFGAKVLASNVVPRPNGVDTVNYGDTNSIRHYIINHINERKQNCSG